MPTDVIDRLPPQNTEAEEAVIGSCLMDSKALDRVLAVLEPGHFYRERNGQIYAAMLALASRREPVDFVTVESELKARGQYEEVGGLPYLSETLGVVPTAVHIEHYAGIVKLAALRRGLISAAGKIAALAYDEAREFDAVLTAAVEQLAGVQVGAGGMDLYTPEQQATMLWDLSQRLAEGKPAGIPSSFYKLTWLTGGYRRGCLYVIGASTGVGKTSWMGTEARALAKAKRRVLFASSEMSVEELVKRNAAAYIGRDWNAIERELSQVSTYPETPGEVGKAVEKMVDEAFHVYHQGSMSVDRIRRRAAKMQAEGGLDLLFVDYLQRLQPVERRGQNREQQVTEIARSLKSLAADLGIPVVVAAQFSRAWMARDDEHKEPILSDFRECVTGDTLVMLADGRRVPIVRLVGTAQEVLATTETGQIISAWTEQIWSVGIRPVFTVTTASGRTLRATGKHRVRGPHEWMQVDDLKPGERIALGRSVPEPDLPVGWPEEHLALLGQLLGDGSYLSHGGVRYTTGSEENSDEFFWDRVISVEEAGEEEVFDLTVPGPASWLADGIVSHNSGGIEQEADVAMALFRRSKFDDHADATEAWLYVLKNRHGQEDTKLRMNWRPETTSYDNYTEERR